MHAFCLSNSYPICGQNQIVAHDRACHLWVLSCCNFCIPSAIHKKLAAQLRLLMSDCRAAQMIMKEVDAVNGGGHVEVQLLDLASLK